MESSKIEDSIGGEKRDGFGDESVDSEDLFKLQNLLWDDGGYTSLHMNKYNF